MMLRWGAVLLGAFDLGLLSASMFVSRDRDRIIRLGPPPPIIGSLVAAALASLTVAIVWVMFEKLRRPPTPAAVFAFVGLLALGAALSVWLRWAARRRRRLAGHDPAVEAD